jgi:DNA-binding winged helix-turn-helix (wHTH) protein
MSTQPSVMASQEANSSPAATTPFPARYARFGAFQADLEREELYKDGQRVKVQSKVFQGLLLLVSRAGEIVTREEVRRQLWPDTFLANLDANVNTTMNKLRQVLGDSPDNPVYVETIPRRGYSFIAAVEYSSAPSATAAEEVANIAPQIPASEAVITKTRVRMLVRVASLLFAGMVVGALLVFVWFFAQTKSQRAANAAKVSASLIEPAPSRSELAPIGPLLS